MPLGGYERQGECKRDAHEIESSKQAKAIRDAAERGGPRADRDIGEHLDRERGAEHGGCTRSSKIVRNKRECDSRKPGAEQRHDQGEQEVAIDAVAKERKHDADASAGGVPPHRSVLPAALIAAYRAAWYRIAHPDGVETVRIGAPAPRAQAWLRELGAAGAVFVTACNPGGQRQEEAANMAAMARLRAHVAQQQRPYREGAGGDDAGAWTPEPSLLVALDTPAEAAALGRAFAQNAVVWIPAEGPARLVLLR